MYWQRRVRLRLWLAIGIAIGLSMVAVRPVAAESGGYPYPAVSCVHAPYATSGSRNGWCPDYDWGLHRGDGSRSSVISPYGYYYRNCTDYAAWWLAAHGVPGNLYKGLGDAKRWAVSAPAKGVHVDSAPAVGSVGVRLGGTYGHLAIVEAIVVPGHPAGTIRVTEYNRQGTGIFGERIGTPAQLQLDRFVHFEVYMPAPAPVPSVPQAAPVVPAPEPVPEVTTPSVPAPPAAHTAPETSVGQKMPEDSPQQPSSSTSEVPTGAASVFDGREGANVVAPEPMPAAELSGAQQSSAHLATGNADVLHTRHSAVTAAPEVSRLPVSGGGLLAAEERVPLPTTAPTSEVTVAPADELPDDAVDVAGPATESALAAPGVLPETSVPHQWWLPAPISPPVLSGNAMQAIASAPAAMWGYGMLASLLLLMAIRDVSWLAVWRWWRWRWVAPETYSYLGG